MSMLYSPIFILFLTWTSYSILYFLRKPLGIIKPALGSSLGLTSSQLGIFDVALLLPYALVQVSSSAIGDKLGPRSTITLCLVVAGTSMATFGLWTNYWVLLILMAINGAAQGPCWPACCKSVSNWYPDANLNGVIGLLSTSVFIGGALGTGLAVYLQSSYGWRMVHVPPSLLAIFIGILVFLFLRTPEEGGISIKGKSAPVSKDVEPANLSFGFLWKLSGVPEITLTVLCLKVVRYCMVLWLPMYLVHYLNYSLAQAGLFSTIFDIGGSLGSPVIGFILDKHFNNSELLGMVFIVGTSTLSMLAFALTASWGLLHNAVFMFIAGATNGGADSLLAGSVSMKLGEKSGFGAGAAVTGFINGIATMGAGVEGPITGLIADTWGWGAVFIFMIVVSAIAMLSVWKGFLVMRRNMKADLAEDKDALLSYVA